MKKTISALLALTIAVSFSGCDSVEDNFNYENANIIENVPSSGKWQRLSFSFQDMCRESSERIIKFAENYGVSGINEDDILLKRKEMNEEGTALDLVPLSEYDKYITSDEFSEYPYMCMVYFSDDLYIEVQHPTGGMIELDNRKNVNSVLQINYSSSGPWRPNFYAKSDTSVSINDENATCILNGKTVKITDAIKNAEEYVAENGILFPKEWTAKVKNAELFTYENGNQSLRMNVEYTIDGIPLYSEASYTLEDENGNAYKTYPIYTDCAMLTENTLDWIWFSAIDGGTEFTSEDCEIEVSREEACKLVSQKLSQEHVFNVEEIQLMYAVKRVGDDDSVIEPMWRFYITGVKSQEYSTLYVFVSALDGEIQIEGM